MKSIRKICVEVKLISALTGQEQVFVRKRGVYLLKGKQVFLWKGKLIAIEPDTDNYSISEYTQFARLREEIAAAWANSYTTSSMTSTSTSYTAARCAAASYATVDAMITGAANSEYNGGWAIWYR